MVADEIMTSLQTVGYSAMIREAFQGDKGLQGIVRKLPIERQFRLDNVKMVSAYMVLEVFPVGIAVRPNPLYDYQTCFLGAHMVISAVQQRHNLCQTIDICSSLTSRYNNSNLQVFQPMLGLQGVHTAYLHLGCELS